MSVSSLGVRCSMVAIAEAAGEDGDVVHFMEIEETDDTHPLASLDIAKRVWGWMGRPNVITVTIRPAVSESSEQLS